LLCVAFSTAYDRVLENGSGVLEKSHGILCNQASGNPVLNNLILAAAAYVWNSLPDLVSSPDTFYSVCWRIKSLQCFDAVGWVTGRASGL